MTIEIENARDALEAAVALEAYLKEAGRRAGCVRATCACSFCRCARKAEKIREVLQEVVR